MQAWTCGVMTVCAMEGGRGNSTHTKHLETSGAREPLIGLWTTSGRETVDGPSQKDREDIGCVGARAGSQTQKPNVSNSCPSSPFLRIALV